MDYQQECIEEDDAAWNKAAIDEGPPKKADA